MPGSVRDIHLSTNCWYISGVDFGLRSAHAQHTPSLGQAKSDTNVFGTVEVATHIGSTENYTFEVFSPSSGHGTWLDVQFSAQTLVQFSRTHNRNHKRAAVRGFEQPPLEEVSSARIITRTKLVPTVSTNTTNLVAHCHCLWQVPFAATAPDSAH